VSYALHWIRPEIHEYILKNWRMVKVGHDQGTAQAVLQPALEEGRHEGPRRPKARPIAIR
jgi:DNA-directed RNA polymerase sigma subunit (sigma70/sigma32)